MSEHYTDEDIERGADAVFSIGWPLGSGPSCKQSSEAVLDAVAPAIAARTLRNEARLLLIKSRSDRDAYLAHNAERDLSKRPPRRPDLRNWADAQEAVAYALNRRADEIEATS